VQLPPQTWMPYVLLCTVLRLALILVLRCSSY
jgi:hypothetical protein